MRNYQVINRSLNHNGKTIPVDGVVKLDEAAAEALVQRNRIQLKEAAPIKKTTVKATTQRTKRTGRRGGRK
jgi:hypothetical protein